MKQYVLEQLTLPQLQNASSAPPSLNNRPQCPDDAFMALDILHAGTRSDSQQPLLSDGITSS
jgi:hypothetical protein